MSSIDSDHLALSFATDPLTIPHEDDRRILQFISVVNAKAIAVLAECVDAEAYTRLPSGFIPPWHLRLKKESANIAERTVELMQACYLDLLDPCDGTVPQGREWYRDKTQDLFLRLAAIQTALFTNQQPDEVEQELVTEPTPTREEPSQHHWCIIL